MDAHLVPAPALVLFDIDGTLLRRSGPHHRAALVEAVRQVANVETTTAHIPVQGMLDRDILVWMMRDGGISVSRIRLMLPEAMGIAQRVYTRNCPDLRSKVCPGVRPLLANLNRGGIPVGLVTGNLSSIAWKKMECAGLRQYILFGAFAEQGSTRAQLACLAIREARRNGWIGKKARVALVGDHPNDVLAAKANRILSVAVATGLVGSEELARHSPDILVEDLRRLSIRQLVER